MDFHLIIETTQNIIKQYKDYVTGANVAGSFILRALIKKNLKNKIFIISSCNKKDFIKFRTGFSSDYNINHTDFYKLTPQISKITSPVISFFPGLDITRLLNIRNSLGIQMPVIGLVHNISKKKEFNILQSIVKNSTKIDSIICPSKSTKKIIENYCQTLRKTIHLKTKVIPYGINTKKFSPADNKEALRKKHNLPLDKKIVLHLSRINPFSKMDILPLIKNFQEIISRNPDTILIIAGQVHVVNYVNQIMLYVQRKNLSKKILFLPDINHQKREEYYQLSDIFVSLSDNISENFGLTVVEAMACGLPVIISDIASYKELISDGKEGFLIQTISAPVPNYDIYLGTLYERDFGDINIQSTVVNNKETREKLQLLLNNDTLRMQIGQAALKRTHKFYNEDKMIQRYQDHFERMLESSQKSEIKKFPGLRFNNLEQIYSNNVSYEMSYTTVFTLTESGNRSIETRKLPLMFEKHLGMYCHISKILTFLIFKPSSLKDIHNFFNTIDVNELLLNILYLMKHDLIEIV
ncbi:MAG: glycosyltransferase family 4 protein [bacterium]|nr:glycosyltransferase family 4 protein [bacterium]